MQARAGGVRGEADRVLKVRGGGQRTDRPTGDTEATRNAHYCGERPEPFRPSLRLATSPVRGGFCGLRPNKAHTACGASGTPPPTRCAAPYKVRRAVGAGHARPAASRNRPFTVDPQWRDSSIPHRVPLPPKQKPRKAPRPARSFCILKNVTPFSRRSAFSARPESRPAVPPAWGRRGQQAPPPRAPHACPSPSACS